MYAKVTSVVMCYIILSTITKFYHYELGKLYEIQGFPNEYLVNMDQKINKMALAQKVVFVVTIVRLFERALYYSTNIQFFQRCTDIFQTKKYCLLKHLSNLLLFLYL